MLRSTGPAASSFPAGDKLPPVDCVPAAGGLFEQLLAAPFSITGTILNFRHVTQGKWVPQHASRN